MTQGMPAANSYVAHTDSHARCEEREKAERPVRKTVAAIGKETGIARLDSP
eukprot:COSAG03_NODE_19199_length_341_cov_0.694215_2_plen_50_part_01